MQLFSRTVTFTDRFGPVCSGSFNWTTLAVNTIFLFAVIRFEGGSYNYIVGSKRANSSCVPQTLFGKTYLLIISCAWSEINSLLMFLLCNSRFCKL